jgi:hypothetical protein
MARQRTSIVIDEELWRRFKAHLALRGKEMSVVMARLIEAYLEADNPLAPINKVLDQTDRQ